MFVLAVVCVVMRVVHAMFVRVVMRIEHAMVVSQYLVILVHAMVVVQYL